MPDQDDADQEGRPDVDSIDDAELDRMLAEGLKEDGPEAGKIKVLECPECGESDLSYVAGMMTGHQYQCPHCEYQGALAVERWRTPDELRKQAEER